VRIDKLVVMKLYCFI